MKRFALAVLVLIVLANACEACWFPGKRAAKNIAERREAGRGLFQRNGPAKRLVRGEVAACPSLDQYLEARRRCRGGKCGAV